jgi:hypothetical protein
MTISRRLRYFFKPEDTDLEPQMFMRKPREGASEAVVAKLKAPTVMGRGGNGYIRSSAAASQRVTVKTKVVQQGGRAEAHARYLEKEAAGLDGEESLAFTATKDDVDLAAEAGLRTEAGRGFGLEHSFDRIAGTILEATRRHDTQRRSR